MKEDENLLSFHFVLGNMMKFSNIYRKILFCREKRLFFVKFRKDISVNFRFLTVFKREKNILREEAIGN